MITELQNDTVLQYERLRAFFETGATRSYKFRKEALTRLYKSIQQHEGALLDAIQKDMGRNEYDAFGGDIGVIYQEITLIKKELRRWMKREPRKTPLSLLPGKSYIIKEPLGVVLIIAPWNYPSNLSFIPLVQAIAAGNCAMVKPSEVASFTEPIILKIIEETFAPEHVFAFPGAGADVLPPLFENVRFDKIFFTGSEHVGKIIALEAAKKLVPITLELGGKSPAILDRSASLKLAARKLVWGKFFNTGQTCIAPDYILVPEEKFQEFVDHCKNAIRGFYGDDPSQSPNFGRIINHGHFDRISRLMSEGTILFGGKTNREDRYISPTILGSVDLDSPLMQEEIFGPLMPIIPYENLEEAFSIIKRNPTPLSLYYFGSNKESKNLVLREISSGTGMVNHTLLHFANANLPFGGVGSSGYGKYHGLDGLNIFTNKKSIMEYPNSIDHSLFYPPFTNLKKRLARFFLR
ncbi:MAG: aldehyde dehydrogenase family protein [Saprospiraceae bacterium]|nr:aldehyde dehydrogenase family protein [Saprospiraceae bacterium]